jgi:signal transduction histidine kinase/ActR/RegA family two-component response regulator
MQAGKTEPNNFSNLRARVERAIRRLNSAHLESSTGLSSAAIGPRHQNRHDEQDREGLQEELQHTQVALETMRSRYFDLLEYTSTLYNSAPVGYFTLTTPRLTANSGTVNSRTPSALVVEANLTAASLLTRAREHLLQQPITDFIVAEDQALFHRCLEQLLATQNTQRCEVRMTRADGSLFFVQLDATLTGDLLTGEKARDNSSEDAIEKLGEKLGGAQYIRSTISDISARVQLEEEERKVRQQLEVTLEELRQTQAQMVRQERLAVVGQLAAGIAHDFNNILAAITLYAQLIKRAPDLPGHLHARMEVIVLQTDRATHLIQQILDFSRRTVIARQPTALSPYLRQFADLLQHTLPETISIRLEIDALQVGIDDVANIDTPRIQQALLNLALNARDAMSDGGELRVALSCIIAGENFPALTSGTLAPGLWLRLDIRDSGVGIPSEELPRIFEPFFTTKGVGSGSGLGLSQVWGIVKQHEGEIDVTSQVGEGTTFSLYLPAVLGASLAVTTPDTTAIPHGNGEVVLVVEDSKLLRTALTSALQQLGYQVVEAKNGQDAAQLMTKEGEKVKLILSDLIMPVMSGDALIRSLRVQGWHQPVVVLSGQPLPESEVERLYSYGQISWLPKPPTLAQLALALNRALQLRT